MLRPYIVYVYIIIYIIIYILYSIWPVSLKFDEKVFWFDPFVFLNWLYGWGSNKLMRKDLPFQT